MAHTENTLGQIIKHARNEKGLGLRELARLISVSPSYITDIEAGRRIPAEATLGALARLLGLNHALLMEQAGRLGEAAEAWLVRTPLAIRLVQRLASSDADEALLCRLLAKVD